MATHGIKAARFRTAGSAGAYTPIANLGDQSALDFEDVEGTKTPTGTPYWGGRKTMAKIETLDDVAYGALLASWKANTRVEVQLDLDDASQVVVTGLPATKPQNVKGASGGARGYEITVRGFAL